jgi:hypothetical protein
MPKYYFSRSIIAVEQYCVEAESEAAALTQLQDGYVEPIQTEFTDWYDDEFSLDHVEDELVTFLQSKETV